MWEEEHAKDHSSYGPTQIKQLQKRENRKKLRARQTKPSAIQGSC